MLLLSLSRISVFFFVVYEVAHHCFELGEVDLTIAVQIHFFYNFPPDIWIFGHVATQDLSDFLSGNAPTTIFIE